MEWCPEAARRTDAGRVVRPGVTLLAIQFGHGFTLSLRVYCANHWTPAITPFAAGRRFPAVRRTVSIDHGSDRMIRTQVRLDEREYALVKKEAKALGISVAEFVRRAVRQSRRARGQAPWMRYAGFVESGDAASSQSIDDIVYGSKD